MFKSFLSIFLATIILLGNMAPVWANTETQIPDIPDWQKITFGGLSPIQGRGEIRDLAKDQSGIKLSKKNAKKIERILGYNPARAWKEGSPVSEVIKLGDLEQFSLPERSLEELTEGTSVDIDKVALSSLGTSSEQTIKSLADVIPELNSVKVGDVPVFKELLLRAANEEEVDDRIQTLTKKWEKVDPRIRALPLSKIAKGDFKGALDSQSEKSLQDLIRRNPALANSSLDKVLKDIKVGDYKAFKDLFNSGDTTGIANIYGRFEQDVAKKLEGIDPLLKDLPLRELIAQDFNGAIDKASEAALEKLADENPLLRNIPLSDIIKGDFKSAAKKAVDKGLNILVSKFISENPTAGNIPLGSNADLAKFAISSIPGLKKTPIGNLPGLKNEPLSNIPGAKELPISEILKFKDLLKIRFAKVDLTLGEKELKAPYTISGSTKGDKFKAEPCLENKKGVKNCAHIELADNVKIPGLSVKGRQWVAGSSQTVKGGKGILALVNNGNEPTGLTVFGPEPNIKVVINNIDEAKAKADLQIYLRVCIKILWTKHCTPYFIGPIPFGSVREKGLVMVASSTPPSVQIPPEFQGQISSLLGQYSPGPSSCGVPTDQDTKYGHVSYEETEREQLISVGSYRGNRTEYMRRDAGTKYLEMRDAAAAQGIYLEPISGFRSIDDQQTLWTNQVGRRGSEQEAAKYSAPPGYSEHHTGLTIDIGDRTAANTDLAVSFESTRAYQWLKSNASSFGFELSFPKGNSQGVSYEPWHWRFKSDTFKKQTANVTPSKKNLDIYLERIRVGESDNCRNVGPNPSTGAYGCYQFIKATRDSVLRLYGVDAWGSKSQQDAAAIALIRDVSKQINRDIVQIIQKGDFKTADALLGKGGVNGSFGTFTSLPGGDEESLKWKDPVLLAKYSPGGSGESAPCGGVACKPGEPCILANPLPQGNLNFRSNVFGAPRPGRIHEGIDLQSPKGASNWRNGPGEPILAAYDGKVEEYTPVGGFCGGVISIWHPDKKIETRYLHMVKLFVQPNSQVKRGQEIGLEGNETGGPNGCSGGTHLHYETRFNRTQLVDPASVPHEPPLPKTPRYG